MYYNGFGLDLEDFILFSNANGKLCVWFVCNWMNACLSNVISVFIYKENMWLMFVLWEYDSNCKLKYVITL